MKIINAPKTKEEKKNRMASRLQQNREYMADIYRYLTEGYYSPKYDLIRSSDSFQERLAGLWEELRDVKQRIARSERALR